MGAVVEGALDGGRGTLDLRVRQMVQSAAGTFVLFLEVMLLKY
jgi:hypothetical protein